MAKQIASTLVGFDLDDNYIGEAGFIWPLLSHVKKISFDVCKLVCLLEVGFLNIETKHNRRKEIY